jgi:leucyl-tRNA synthetase
LGATFIVVAPEHPFVASLLNSKFKTQKSNLKEIHPTLNGRNQIRNGARAEGRKKQSIYRILCDKSLERIQNAIWISDFALWDLGQVRGWCSRSRSTRFEFAKEFDIPVIRVVVGKDGDKIAITEKKQVQKMREQ